MEEVFVQSQWDTLIAYLREGRPPLWVPLAIVNGGFLAFWVYAKISKDRPLRPASVTLMRVLLVLLNVMVIFSDETLRILRPFLSYLI
jgi:hypothetical protein